MKVQKEIITIISALVVVFIFNSVLFGQNKVVAKPKTVPVPIDESILRTGGHFLAWGPIETNPSGFVDCLGIGEIALRGFQNFRRSQSEVTGSYGMNYASITCLGNTAYVMVVGSEKKKTTEIHDVLMDRFNNSNLPLPTASQSKAENYLYFSTTQTKVSKLENCRSIAANAIDAILPNFRKMPNGASGSGEQLSAGIACRQTGSRMSAIIIVGGKSNKEVLETRAFLTRKMATTVLIDEGTELNPVDGD